MAKQSATPGLWAIGPYQFKTLPNQTCLVVRGDTGAVSAMDARWKPMLSYLERFRTLDQHMQTLLARNPSLRPHAEAMEAVLERFCQEGILTQGEALVSAMTASADQAASPGPLCIAITTCDRPQQLERLLESLVVNEREFGGRWVYQVVDDSHDPECIRHNQSVLDRYRQQLELQYHGREERAAFVERLTHEMPERADDLRWLLDSEHPDHAGRPTYGCPKNYLMLRFAGARLILIDDDAVMRGWKRSDCSKSVRFDEVGVARDLFPSIEAAEGRLVHVPADPIAEHAHALGGTLDQLGSRVGLGLSSDDLLGRARFAQVQRVGTAPPRIRATMSSLVGDPGTASDLTLLSQFPADALSKATDETYRALVGGRRCVFNGKPWSVVTNQGYFLLATMAGLDLSGYAAPLMPAGRGEDGMIARWLGLLFPRDLAFVSAVGLEHRPVPDRPWRLDLGSLAQQLSPATALGVWASSLAPDMSFSEPRAALSAIATQFRACAASRGGRQQLGARLTRTTKQTWAQIYGDLATALEANKGSAPEAWKKDVSDRLLGLQRMLMVDQIASLDAVERLINTNDKFFAALTAWNDARALVLGGALRSESIH